MQNRIKEIRKSLGLSQQELADRMGTIRGQVSKLENGGARLNDVWMGRLASALNCQPAELIAESSEREIPIIGEVPGGDLIEAMAQPALSFVRFGSRRPNLCALRVRGNSMSRIAPDGMYAVVDMGDNDPAALVNQPVVFCIDDGHGCTECSFKVFKTNPDRFEPHSIEPGYDTIFPNGREWRIFGRVIGVVGYVGRNNGLLIGQEESE